MKKLLLSLLLSAPAFGIYSVGDKPANTCWKDMNDATVCLDDNAGKVRVLLFNAGWCGPCNSEFAELTRRTRKYAGKNVVFISLSAEGWTGGSSPNQQFLREWATKHGLDKAAATFIVAASPRNAGRDYFSSPSIPNVAVIDSSGAITYKAIAPGLTKLTYEVDKAK